MNRWVRWALFFLLFSPVLAIHAEVPPPTATAQIGTPQAREQYSLSGNTLQKAIHVSHIRNTMHFVSAAWDITLMVLIAMAGIPAYIRDIAVRTAKNRWLQGLVFVPLFVLLTTFIDLPIDIYMQHIDRVYGLSVQSWSSWAWDATKAFLITFIAVYLLGMLILWLIRSVPRQWWFVSWLAIVPIIVFVLFIHPMALEPLFGKYEPLQKANPKLACSIQEVLHHAHVEIPTSNLKLEHASDKTTQLNAYVSGIGATKQVVVWDTTADHMSVDQVQFVVGHELGHYVLHHIPKQTAFTCFFLLFLLLIGYKGLNWLIARFGVRWRIPSQDDWAALYLLLFVFFIVSFLSEPVINGVSRHYEHEADIYGLEALHGLVPNPQQTAAQSFQAIGEASLVDPAPNAFVQFWVGSHPSIPERLQFAANYDPWRDGQQPKYFKK